MGRSRKSTEAGNATNRPVSAPVLSSTHSLVRPKKFYSERNREELANALTDLTEILSKYDSNILPKTHHAIDIWHLGSNRISPYDIINLITELKDVGNGAEKLYHELR